MTPESKKPRRLVPVDLCTTPWRDEAMPPVDPSAGLQALLQRALAPPAPSTRTAYDAIRRLNWSTLRELARSPAAFLHAAHREASDGTAAQQRGTLTHLAAFEPAAFADVVVWHGKVRNGGEWEAFKKLHAGRRIVLPKEHREALVLATAARSDAQAAPYLAGGKAEQTLEWTFTAPPLAPHTFSFDCKGRVDFERADCLVDLKITRDASPEGFAAESWRYGYHKAAAWYVDGRVAAGGPRKPFVLVAVEHKPPHVVQVYRVPEALMDEGRAEYQRLLERLHECLVADSWPGYANAVLELEPPRWARPAGDDLSELDLDFSGVSAANTESEE